MLREKRGVDGTPGAMAITVQWCHWGCVVQAKMFDATYKGAYRAPSGMPRSSLADKFAAEYIFLVREFQGHVIDHVEGCRMAREVV